MTDDAVQVAFGARRGAPNAGFIAYDNEQRAITQAEFVDKTALGSTYDEQLQGALRQALSTITEQRDLSAITLYTPHIDNPGLAIGRLPPTLRQSVTGRITTVNSIPHTLHGVLKGFCLCHLSSDWSVRPDRDIHGPFSAYVDASFMHDSNHGSVGYLVTDTAGQVILIRACSVGQQQTSHSTEVVGVRLVLNDIARTLGPDVQVTVNTDCSYVLDKLKNPTEGRRTRLLRGIQAYINEYSAGVRHVEREDTAFSDTLATLSRHRSFTHIDPALTTDDGLTTLRKL